MSNLSINVLYAKSLVLFSSDRWASKIYLVLSPINFAKYLVLSNIIPEDFDVKETTQKIIEDYNRAYKIYEVNIGDNYKNVNQFIMENKDKIKNEIARRYFVLQRIKEENKLQIEGENQDGRS